MLSKPLRDGRGVESRHNEAIRIIEAYLANDFDLRTFVDFRRRRRCPRQCSAPFKYITEPRYYGLGTPGPNCCKSFDVFRIFFCEGLLGRAEGRSQPTWSRDAGHLVEDEGVEGLHTGQKHTTRWNDHTVCCLAGSAIFGVIFMLFSLGFKPVLVKH